MDGTTPRTLPVELQNVSEATITAVTITDASEIAPDSLIAACLHDSPVPAGQLWSESESSRQASPIEHTACRGIEGCDNTLGPRENDRPWCGGAYGQLFDGRLRDPRLNIGCMTEEDENVGFAWVHPAKNVRYVSVEQPEYVEVYEVTGGLPVRVATRSGVKIEGSRATFDLLEHDSDGQLVRRYRLETAVAG